MLYFLWRAFYAKSLLMIKANRQVGYRLIENVFGIDSIHFRTVWGISG